MVGPVRREDDRQNGGNNRYNPFGITKSSFPQSANAPHTPAQPAKPQRWNQMIKAMPKNGMHFPDRASVCRRVRRDRAIWYSVDGPFLYAKPKDIVEAVIEMVNSAVFAARQTKPPADYFEALNMGNSTAAFEAFMHFFSTLRGIVPFAQEVSPPVFAEFFSEVIKARSAYFEYYEERGWHVPPREEHSPMALAVDKFLSVAWFWDDMHAVTAAEGEQQCDEDKEWEEEKVYYVQHEPVADDDALGSLVANFDGFDIWAPVSDDKYEDDVEPITDDEEDVVMGGV